AIWILDPALSDTFEQGEVLGNVFEMLTRAVQGTVHPWLASEVRAEADLARYRIRLRPGVRFHDGRRLTARDVRFSFERLLQSEHSQNASFLSSVCGEKAVIAGGTPALPRLQLVSPP